MRYWLLIPLALLAAPAMAQEAQPVTLTPDEYGAVVSQLIHENPALEMLVRKQHQAQMEALAKAAAAPKASP